MSLFSSFNKKRNIVLPILLTVAFLLVNSFCLAKDWYYISLIPLAALVLLLFVLRLETGLLCIALMTPLAINVSFFETMELSLPVEPMMILFTFFFLFRVLLSRGYDKALLSHPVSIIIFVMMIWMFISSCFSQVPLASFKYMAARLWFLIPFFFAAAQMFKDFDRIRQFYWCYAIGLMVVVVISTVKTVGNFSDLQTLHRVMCPFYNDHTAYGCVIALMLPATYYFLFSKSTRGFMRVLYLLMFALLATGLFFSYCRAAWLSVIAAVGMFVLIRMGVKLKWMACVAAVAIGLFFTFQGDLLYKMGKNHQDSSYDLADQVKSISNISTDASNLERLNRWAAAFRLWNEHPVVGIGPGAYQFVYASYQRSYQLSTISTNAGDNGNAHSEYIGPLTEQGVVGVAIVVVLFVVVFATGVRVYRTAKDRMVANMSLAFTLSLLTYYVHGFFNNFLDTDKLSVPFWAFTAVIVALDVYAEKREEK